MVARLVEATEPIEVKQLVTLIYGQGGSRKTSLAQTADKPFTLAFDPGITRAFGRKACMLFDGWGDVVLFEADAELLRRGQEVPQRGDAETHKRYLLALHYYVEARTVVIDTVGMAIDRMSEAILTENTRNGNPMGGLSLPGFGVLKQRFYQWAAPWRARGQDVVLISHEKENKKGDQPYYQPDIVGGSYNTVMNHADAVGYMCFDGGKRIIDFYPNDRFFAKVPPCGWTRFALPDFGKEPDFLAKLLAQAKESMGRVSGESAKMAGMVEEWRAKVAACTSAEQLNAILPSLRDMAEAVKRPAWALTLQHAERHGWKWDGTTKTFAGPAAAAPPPPPELPREPGIEEEDEAPTQFNKPKKARKKAETAQGGAA